MKKSTLMLMLNIGSEETSPSGRYFNIRDTGSQESVNSVYIMRRGGTSSIWQVFTNPPPLDLPKNYYLVERVFCDGNYSAFLKISFVNTQNATKSILNSTRFFWPILVLDFSRKSSPKIDICS